MGEMSQSASSGRSFSADHLFDPDSDYGRLHASMKPDAKMRGFFHYLGVQQKVKQPSGRAVTITKLRSASLVVTAGGPETPLASECAVELAPGGGKSRLVVTCQLIDKPMRPPAGTACRALLLTRGMMERLCGPDAVRSDDAARRSLSRLLAGRGEGNSFEMARILAAVPELEGEVDSSGMCRFVHFEVPEQASHVDELPERTMLVIVVARPRG